VAVAAIVVFASLNAIDGVACPDGCTHEKEISSQPGGSQLHDGICVLCVGGVNSSASEDLSPGALVAVRVAPAPTTNPGDVPPDPPEHPPRA
jgi:hypothetical protein